MAAKVSVCACDVPSSDRGGAVGVHQPGGSFVVFVGFAGLFYLSSRRVRFVCVCVTPPLPTEGARPDCITLGIPGVALKEVLEGPWGGLRGILES